MYTDALTEIDAFFRKSGRVIIPLTVREILDEEIGRDVMDKGSNIQPNPNVPLNCPRCGRVAHYQGTVRNIHIYNCSEHGRLCLRPDGTFTEAKDAERWFQPGG
jgi:hypothetical protein